MRVLIAGSTGGVGRAVASACRASGHDVVTLDHADFEAGDWASRLKSFAPLDGFAFCAGVCPVKPVALTDDALFAETMRVNCGLFFSLMREIVANKLFSPSLFRVAAVSSVSATEGWPGGSAYCASKGALSALCRALEAELRAKNIRVHAFEPRHIKTRMFDTCAGRMGVPDSSARPPEDFAKDVLRFLEGGDK